MDLIDMLNRFAENHPWVPVAVGFYLVFVKVVQGLRDALDKTPNTDDNVFERAATIIVKLGGYLVGVRPKAPPEAKPVPGASDDATGVKVK